MDPNAPATAAPASSPSAAPKLVPFGKYLLLERVAVGGMAEVWLAKRVQGDGVSELLAVKRILPNLSADAEFVKMFVDEARIAGQLQHPGIVPMQELGRIGQSFYIAMEYVWGRDLLQLLRTLKQAGEKISFAAAAYIGARVCEALHYAHVKVDSTSGKPLELVHRDVSPQNVLVSFDGKVKLIDFGIAKATSRTTKTQAGTLKGKVGYMSPEQVRGLPVDARSDLFAVGTLLYEMLTVRPLFARGNNFEAMNRVRDADVQPIAERVPDCPPALAAIVMRALSRDASDRFPTAQDMQRALTVFLTEHVSSFERYDLATWLRRLYEDEFAREKARLDALDSIGRPAISPVAKKYANPVTSLEIATTSLFDAADDEEETQVAEHAPYHPIQLPEGPSEVFFHRDDVVRVGELNPEGQAARPLKALFRPGKADAVEAFRPPIVARDDSTAREPAPPMLAAPPDGAATASPTAARAPTSVAPAAAAPPATTRASRPSPPAMPRGTVPPPRTGPSAMPLGRRGTLAPPVASASAVPPPARPPARPSDTARTVPAMASVRPAPMPSARPATSGHANITQPFGVRAQGASAAPQASPEPAEDRGRITHPHHSSRPAPPMPDPITVPRAEAAPPTDETPLTASVEISAPFEQVSSLEVEPVGLKAPTLRRVAVAPEEDDETFDDGGIREPLVPPTAVSRARIVAVSDAPPSDAPPRRAPTSNALPHDVPTMPGRPGTVPLVGPGDTPSTSAITKALEQMARERPVSSSTSSSGQIPAQTTDPGRVSGFALDPQSLNSQIIRQILGPSAASESAPRRGEPTEGFTTAQQAGRVAHLPTLLPRTTTGDYVFFVVVALMTVALGGTAAVALLHADAGAALEVHCVPAVEATVLVDGAPRGRAPVRIEDLAPGQHTVTIVAHGFEEAHRQVAVAPRESASIEIALQPEQPSGPSGPVPSGVLPPEPPPGAPPPAGDSPSPDREP